VSGSHALTGPPLDLCNTVMGMKPTSYHRDTKLMKSKCELFPECKREFLPSQVNGAAWMVQRAFGEVPVSEEMLNDPKVKAAHKKLTCVATYGGIVADGTGLGKTCPSLLAISFLSEFRNHKYDTDHRPMLIACPNGSVLKQWAKEGRDNFKNLRFITAYGDAPSNPTEAKDWISAKAMLKAPVDMSLWGDKAYVFDKTNPKASKVVILTTYDTFTKRSVIKIRKKGEPKSKTHFKSRFSDHFAVVMLDEGHKVRHVTTQYWASIKKLNAPINFFLTATPVVNAPDVRTRKTCFPTIANLCRTL
jgi:SNF2 family DNA or RNA helicase